MSYETDNWPYIPAVTQKAWPTRRPIRVIVIHDMEFPEKLSAAEDVGRYFQHPDKPSSAHIGVDADSIIQYVKDNSEAAAAPGCNADGIQIELAGYGRQTRAEWLDPFGVAMLALAADATAQYCLKYSIPPAHLTNAQLLAKEKGIVGHVQVSQVYHKSDHTDPGAAFPWDYFIQAVRAFYNVRSTKVST